MKPSNLCRNLRNKAMYIPALADNAFSEGTAEEPRSGHCWCNRTLTEVGPDDRLAGPRDCTKGRSCFEE